MTGYIGLAFLVISYYFYYKDMTFIFIMAQLLCCVFYTTYAYQIWALPYFFGNIFVACMLLAKLFKKDSNPNV